MCHCPAHEDRTPSLSIRAGRTNLLVKCFAGCPTRDVLRALRALQLEVPRSERNAPDHLPPPNKPFAHRARALGWRSWNIRNRWRTLSAGQKPIRLLPRSAFPPKHTTRSRHGRGFPSRPARGRVQRRRRDRCPANIPRPRQTHARARCRSAASHVGPAARRCGQARGGRRNPRVGRRGRNRALRFCDAPSPGATMSRRGAGGGGATLPDLASSAPAGMMHPTASTAASDAQGRVDMACVLRGVASTLLR